MKGYHVGRFIHELTEWIGGGKDRDNYKVDEQYQPGKIPDHGNFGRPYFTVETIVGYNGGCEANDDVEVTSGKGHLHRYDTVAV